ncbi:Prolyl oligopeptidase [Pestalotiopsis sp. IQ-011]
MSRSRTILTAVLAASGAWALTPEGMLAANRYSDALPNPAGDFAIFSVSNYSFETKETASEWRRLDLKTGDISIWPAGADLSEFVFIDDTKILYVNGTNEEGDGGVSLYSADVDDLESATLLASLPAPFSGLKAAKTSSGDIHFLISAQAYPNGTAYNEALAEASPSTARIYTSIFVRHWDHWLTPYKNAVFGGVLSGGLNTTTYTFDGVLTNYVTGIANVSSAESPLDNSGPSDYALSPDGTKVAFLTKDINLPIANYTSSQIYLVPFSGSSEDAVPINARGGTQYPEAQGASSGPVFSPGSDKIAYVQQNGIYYESDREIVYVANTDGPDFNVTRLAGNWDRSPDTPIWSKDGETVVVEASDLGRTRLFPIPLSAGDDYEPANITDEGTPAGYYVISNDTLLVSDSKLWSSRDIYSVSLTGEVDTVYYQANLADPELAGLSAADVSEFYYETNTSVSKQQAWIIYPADFDASKKYPLAFITHGGPQGSNGNGWSTRWNFKVWADQGYVVVAPNPSASIGWGQNLTDAVQGRWGSYPYWDIVHAWKYVNETLDYVDTVNGIHAGASFGGFMSNWVQGHEMGRWFKALVTHDGSTSTLNQYASEELWFMDHDFKRPFAPSEDLKPGSVYYDWNPLLFADQWATPHFVVHNTLDYRLPESEGILLFNQLQVQGVPSKFLNFPDENHWVTKRENSLVWHTEIFKWINYYSGLSDTDSPY